jgi:redox-sensing transcriptional repressor
MSQFAQEGAGTPDGAVLPALSRRSLRDEFRQLPDATVARLPEYLRALHELAQSGHDTVSSEALATTAGVK